MQPLYAEPLRRAVAICGSQSELGRRIGVKQNIIYYWMVYARIGVAPEYARAIEMATNGAVTRYELRPDIFGEAPESASA